jgi:hypothetical protein
LKALKRAPGRAERRVYLAVIAVLTLGLLVVMGASRYEARRAEALHQIGLMNLRAEMQHQEALRAEQGNEEVAYIRFLESHLFRYEVGDPAAWREFAESFARVVPRKTEFERLAHLFEEGRYQHMMELKQQREWQKRHPDLQ